MSYVGGRQVIEFRPSGDQDWARQSECAKLDPTMMFPHEQDHTGIRLAKDACGRCPVRLFCLEEALDRNESHGIWGGFTTEERRVQKRQAMRKAASVRKLKAVEAKADAVLDSLAAASGLIVEDV